jgi:uncharacterized protein (TIGR02001 family)
MRLILKTLFICSALVIGTATTQAEDAPDKSVSEAQSDADAPTEIEEDEPEPSEIGLSVEVTWASSYIFRGLNVFKEESQMDQNMLLAPGITWKISDSGFSLGYWGAFQSSGNNVSRNIERGLGAEQDLFVAYEENLSDNLVFGVGFLFYLYPFADEALAGTSSPTYFEPSLNATYSTFVDVSFKVAYLGGLQIELEDSNYLYLNPTFSRHFDLHEKVGLDFYFGYGYKVFKDKDTVDNKHDIRFTVALPLDIAYGLYLIPSFNAGWTNLAPIPADEPILPDSRSHVLETTPIETSVWAGLTLGMKI